MPLVPRSFMPSDIGESLGNVVEGSYRQVTESSPQVKLTGPLSELSLRNMQRLQQRMELQRSLMS